MNEMLLFTLPKDKWITIADTTLTEEVASIGITTDIGGNPFKCKKLYVELTTPKGISSCAGVVAHEWMNVAYVPSMVSTNGRITKCFMVIEGGMFTTKALVTDNQSNAQASPAPLYQKPFGGLMIDALISAQVFLVSGTFPVGTTIKVLGVEA